MPEVTISDASAALLRELRQGMHAEHGDPRTEAELVENAIVRIHRGFFGVTAAEGGPDEPTGPFRKWASDRPAEVLLRQVDPKSFRLAQPFRYNDGIRRFEIPEDDVTDLASVPRFLTWLVPRYGRHTLAALTHDFLQAAVGVSSEEADLIFRDAMGDTGVPLTRRWVMWSAVALRTQVNLGGARKWRALAWAGFFGIAALILWPTLFLLLAFSFGLDTLAISAAAVVAAVAAPFALSAVWGRLWKVGAFSGAALMFITVQIVLVLLALGIYFGVEWAVERTFVKPRERNPVLTRNL